MNGVSRQGVAGAIAAIGLAAAISSLGCGRPGPARLVGGDGVAPAISPAARSDPDAPRTQAAAAAARPLGAEWFRDHVVEVEITGDDGPLAAAGRLCRRLAAGAGR